MGTFLPSSRGDPQVTGSLTDVDYSDATPDVVNTYDRMGRQLTSATLLPGNAEHQLGITYGYSPATLALITETWQGLVTDTLTRSTDPLGRNAGFQTLGGMDLDYAYDATGRFAAITSVVATVTNVATYTNDALGRRTQRLDTGTVGFQPATNSFTYNVRSELETALFSPLGAPSTSSATYQYDPIGNRIQAVENSVQTDYVSNMLNQYTAINAATPSYDDDGNLLFLPSTSGGGAGGEGWYFQWDGENRLLTASNATTVITNTYDSRSRRIRKQVAVYNSTSDLWLPTSDLRYFYDGWSLLHEHDVITGTPVTHYLWGLDLSGTLQGAGGVGGLLAEIRSGQAAASASDANGNITEYVNASTGVLSARYAYDGFGKTIATSGPSSASFTHRFSSKYLDAEIGWYYYGYRFFAPEIGRWPNRDPIGEKGGENYYRFVENNAINFFDPSGLKSWKVGDPLNISMRGAQFFGFGFDGRDIIDVGADKSFPSRGSGQAKRFIEEYFDINTDGKLDAKDCPPFKLNMTGYSWGAWSILEVAHEYHRTHKDKFLIRMGLVDPVSTLRASRTCLKWDWVGSHKSRERKCLKWSAPIASKPGNVIYGINYYQTIGGAGTLADGLFVGSSIPEMDINMELGYKHNLQDGFAHVQILDLTQEARAVPNNIFE